MVDGVYLWEYELLLRESRNVVVCHLRDGLDVLHPEVPLG